MDYTLKKDKEVIEPYVTEMFEKKVIPALMDYIRIPNVSPSYDPQWDINGNQEKACTFLANWVNSQGVLGLTLNIYKEKNRTPFIYIEINNPFGQIDKRTVLFYSHFDKQPEFSGWSEGLGPTKPVIKDGKLYGRGGADDGYALFGVITAIKAIQDNHLNHPKIVMIVEGAEESYADDLVYYLSALKDKIGNPDLIVCLDSGIEDYKRLWFTTSLRGVCTIDLTVKVLSIGMHSGAGGGIIPDSFMIIRQLLDRIEDSETGEIIIPELKVDLPEKRKEEIERLVEIVKDDFVKQYPFYDKTQPIHKEIFDLVVNNTWKATLAITGADGFPETNIAGNVLRPYSSFRLSFRLPPGLDTKKAGEKLVEVLKKEPPFNAVIETNNVSVGDGWSLKDENMSKSLKSILNDASLKYFNNNNVEAFGEGGSVPFVQTFNNAFPKAQLTVLGVTGPGCNIHGPDENLDLDFCRRLICCIAHLISHF